MFYPDRFCRSSW